MRIYTVFKEFPRGLLSLRSHLYNNIIYVLGKRRRHKIRLSGRGIKRNNAVGGRGRREGEKKIIFF